ncbi:MurR/RpiR family transcriptional regulator [Streptococcus gallolyticus]|uniref:MurR/RpiR family transcriptional regulator n=1 Tax=Streptococcus gallolyticus TaxID=315405 RepID=UPI003D6EFA8C
MNPLIIMESLKEQFSPAELAIYDLIKKQPSLVTHATTTDLAKKAGVSQPTLTRFVKKQLGYKRYQDFRFDFINWLSSNNATNTDEDNEYFTRLTKLLELTKATLTDEVMTDLASFLSQSDHLFATGGAKSFLSAKLFETLMRKMGVYVSSYSTDYLDDAVNYFKKDDLLLIFSAGGDSTYIRKITNLKCKTLLVTANPNAKYRKHFDKVITLPTLSGDWEYDSISPIMFDIFTELLVTHYAKQMKN